MRKEFQHTAARRRLPKAAEMVRIRVSFQHTAARRRLLVFVACNVFKRTVSTHSRPKAAALVFDGACGAVPVSTHSRPKAAASVAADVITLADVSTHSRPKAAASIILRLSK